MSCHTVTLFNITLFPLTYICELAVNDLMITMIDLQ